jgi:hypothetical protein
MVIAPTETFAITITMTVLVIIITIITATSIVKINDIDIHTIDIKQIIVLRDGMSSYWNEHLTTAYTNLAATIN